MMEWKERQADGLSFFFNKKVAANDMQSATTCT